MIHTFLYFIVLHANAQDAGNFTILNGEIISADLFATDLPNGAGSPSVQWDPVAEEFVMAFETEDTTPPANCAEGWRIRFATADYLDGTWTLLPNLQVGPNTVQGRECGARRPGFVIEDSGDWAMVYNVLASANSNYFVQTATKTSSGTMTYEAAPLEHLSAPTMVKYDGEWHVFGIDREVGSATNGDLMYSTSTDIFTWSVPTSVLSPGGAVLLTANGMFSPSMLCIDYTAYPWYLWANGWNGSNDMTSHYYAGDTAWNWYVSVSGNPVFYAPVGNDVWRQIDVIMDENAAPDNVTAIVYEDIDPVSGLPRIGVATNNNTLDIDTSNLRDRDCVP